MLAPASIVTSTNRADDSAPPKFRTIPNAYDIADHVAKPSTGRTPPSPEPGRPMELGVQDVETYPSRCGDLQLTPSGAEVTGGRQHPTRGSCPVTPDCVGESHVAGALLSLHRENGSTGAPQSRSAGQCVACYKSRDLQRSRSKHRAAAGPFRCPRDDIVEQTGSHEGLQR